MTGIIISSVVPPIMFALEAMCRKYFHIAPLVVGPGVKTGLNIKYENPREVGADRIVNAVSALAQYGGKPLIVVDFGTAITYCYLNEQGTYMGEPLHRGLRFLRKHYMHVHRSYPASKLQKPSKSLAKIR